MYVKRPDLKWLYPGDIIKDLILPNLKNDAFLLLSQSGDNKEYLVRSVMPQEFFVYLSHECDFNDNKRQYLILTPMVGIDAGLRRNPKDLESLISSNDVENNPRYLNQFYFSASSPALQEDKRIDFTRLISFPFNKKDELLKNKCLQLKKTHRLLLKKKLGYYFFHEEKAAVQSG